MSEMMVASSLQLNCGKGAALWFDASLLITTPAPWLGCFTPAALHCIPVWHVDPLAWCPTCRRNKVELFLVLLSILQDLFMCTPNFNEIVLWWYEGFNFGSRGKKGFDVGFMCLLASRLSRYNIPSNTIETTMAANASQWLADQRQYSHHNWRQSCEKVLN